jgi:hypothetical protein
LIESRDLLSSSLARSMRSRHDGTRGGRVHPSGRIVVCDRQRNTLGVAMEESCARREGRGEKQLARHHRTTKRPWPKSNSGPNPPFSIIVSEKLDVGAST